MIDWVSVLAPSRASPLPQGFMLIADVVYDAESCGGGSVTVPRRLHVVIETPRDIHGSIA